MDKNLWELFLKELDYDAKCVRVHLVNALANIRSQKSERDVWKTKVCQDLKSQVERFLDGFSSTIDSGSVTERERRIDLIKQYKEQLTGMARATCHLLLACHRGSAAKLFSCFNSLLCRTAGCS